MSHRPRRSTIPYHHLQTSTMSKSPDIPVELVLTILSLAAYSSQQSALSICLVATWTRAVAEPALYQTVSIKREDAHQRLMRTLAGHKIEWGVRSSFSFNVRALLNSYAFKEDLLRCITSCPNIESLAIRGSQLFHLTTLLRETNVMPEDERHANLAGNVKKLTILNIAHPLAWSMGSQTESPRFLQFLSNITHLVSIDSTGPIIHLPLRSFPNLTHIAVPFDGVIPSDIHRQDTIQVLDRAKIILSEAGKKLEMLILHISGEKHARRQEDWHELPSVLQGLILDANRRDARIFILPMNRYESFVFHNWEKEARGDEAIWDEAIDLLRKTRKNRSSAKLGRRLSF